MRLAVASVLAAVGAGSVGILVQRDRLLSDASERASELLASAPSAHAPGEWLVEYDGDEARVLFGAPGETALDAAGALAAAQSLGASAARGRVVRAAGEGGLTALRSDGASRVAGAPVVGLRAVTQTGVLIAALAGGGFVLCAVWASGLARRAVHRSARRLGGAVARVGRSERFRAMPGDVPREFERLTRDLNRTLGSLVDRVTQLASQRSEAKAILRSMPGAVIALDLAQRIMNTNRVAERLLNLDPDAVRGRLLQEAVRHPRLMRFAEKSIGAADLRRDEFPLRGTPERIVSASSRPLLDADGSMAGVVIVLQDVTRLRKLESMRRDFASNASHELRTPVTNILGYIETLDECADADVQERSRFIAIIRRNAKRLAAIIEDMLELARLETPESGGLRGVERAQVRGLLEEVASGFAPDLERKRIRVSLDCPEEIEADINSGLLMQAMGNLLANAIRYSPESTMITLSGEFDESRQSVLLAVRDEGAGIPEEHLSRLFERFYRVDPARSRELGGTGLGLAIAKHVAILHGGEIGVTSEVGLGSRFWISVPRVAERRDRA